MTDRRSPATCECGATAIHPAMVLAMPTWGPCNCGACRVACIPDEDGKPALVKLVDRPLRKGDQVLVRHIYVALGGGSGIWYTVEAIGRGGKKPRYANGSPVELNDVVGVLAGV